MNPGGVINWPLLAEAVEFYKDAGFEYRAVPWMVRPDITDVTLPESGIPVTTSRGFDLVGSGEQGFLQLLLDGKLAPGRYVTLTPCFRGERKIDEQHHPWFAKVELIHVLDEDDDADQALEAVMDTAWDFFSAYLGCHAEKMETDHPMWDMITENTPEPIELGSYGIREHNDIRWVYGTGLAEPRFSFAMEQVCVPEDEEQT